MHNAYDILFAHVVLPDSLEGRKKVLKAFAQVLRPTHPAFRMVKKQLLQLEELESAQRELPLKFTEEK